MKKENPALQGPLKQLFFILLLAALLTTQAFATASPDAGQNPGDDCQCGVYEAFETGLLEPGSLFYWPNNFRVEWSKLRIGAVLNRNDRVLSVQTDFLFSNPTLDGTKDTFLSLASELKFVPFPGKVDFYGFGGFGQEFALGHFEEQHYVDFPAGLGLEFFPEPQSKFLSFFAEAEFNFIYRDNSPLHLLFFPGLGVSTSL